ncbi:MAG: tetratricopeptide repeat protein [Bdellovibrionales bacterium]
MRLLTSAILILTLAGCSSSNHSGSSSSTDTSGGLTDINEAPQKPSAQPLPPVALEPEKTASATAPTSAPAAADRLEGKLNNAIQKQDERAIAISARELLIRNPQDIKALNALALYHFRQGEIEMAKSLLTKAIAIDGNVSMLHTNLGMVHQTQAELYEALQSYRAALRVDPSNAIAAANIGALYAQKKDYRKAQVALEIAVQKGQRDWRTLSNYGVTLMALGKYQNSEPYLKRSMELQPQNVEILLNYAILLIEHLGKPSEGLDVISKIRFAGPGPELRKRISDLENRAKSVLK